MKIIKNCFYSTLYIRCLSFYEIKLTVLNTLKKLKDFCNMYPSIIIFFLFKTCWLKKISLYKWVFCVYACIQFICLVPTEARRGQLELWMVMWAQVTEPGSSVRATNALNCLAISPAPMTTFLKHLLFLFFCHWKYFFNMCTNQSEY